MAAIITLEALTGAPEAPTYTPVTSQGMRFRSDSAHLRNTASPLTPPAARKLGYANSALAGGTSPQPLTVLLESDEAFLYAADDYLIIDAGTDLQEIVKLTEVSEAACSVTAIFRRSHSAGALLEACSAAGVPKVFGINVATKPNVAVSNICFHRQTDLPPGVFDTYRVLASFAGDIIAAPDFSSDSVVSTRVPTAPEPIYGNPRTAAGRVPDVFIELRWVLTQPASSGAMLYPEYRLTWSES